MLRRTVEKQKTKFIGTLLNGTGQLSQRDQEIARFKEARTVERNRSTNLKRIMMMNNYRVITDLPLLKLLINRLNSCDELLGQILIIRLTVIFEIMMTY